MRNLFFFSILTTTLLTACGSESSTTNSSNSNNNPTVQKEQIDYLTNQDDGAVYTHCYRNIQSFANEENARDIDELMLYFEDDVAKGVYNSIPAFRDKRYGRIEGKRSRNQVQGQYIFVQEGKIDTAQLKIIFRDEFILVIGEPVELGLTNEIEVTDCNTSPAD